MVVLFTRAANVRPRLCCHGSVAGKARRAGDETKERKMQMEGRNPLVSTQGLFLARLTGDRQLASALNAEALWSLLLCAPPLVAKQNHSFIIHPFLLFRPISPPFPASGTIFHFSRKT